MLRFVSLVALSLSLACGSAFAQAKLELKYPPGVKSTSESTVTTHQILTIGGMDIETTSNTFSLTSKKIGQPDEDGTLSVLEKVDVLQTEVGLPGGIKIQFDSANPEKKADIPQLEPIMERLRVTFTTPVTTILDEKRKLKEVKFPDGVVESLDSSNKSLFDPVKRKKAAEQASGFLPSDAVKPGETWERATEADFGGGQTMAFRTKYTYVGTVDQDGKTYDKIAGKVFEVSYSVDPSNAALQVTKSDLKVTESDATILFDRERGDVEQKTSKLRIQGPLTLNFNGMELEGKLDLTIEDKSKHQK
jgi:hypothetical protein